MSSYRDFLKEQLKDPELKAEYDALEPEFAIIQAMIDARKTAGLTQKQLAERTGIAQADISRLENGNANPSLKTLQRLAKNHPLRADIFSRKLFVVALWGVGFSGILEGRKNVFARRRLPASSPRFVDNLPT